MTPNRKGQNASEDWFFELPSGWRQPTTIRRDAEEEEEDAHWWDNVLAPAAALHAGYENCSLDAEEVAPGVFEYRVLVYRAKGPAIRAAALLLESRIRSNLLPATTIAHDLNVMRLANQRFIGWPQEDDRADIFEVLQELHPEIREGDLWQAVHEFMQSDDSSAGAKP